MGAAFHPALLPDPINQGEKGQSRPTGLKPTGKRGQEEINQSKTLPLIITQKVLQRYKHDLITSGTEGASPREEMFSCSVGHQFQDKLITPLIADQILVLVLSYQNS